MQKNNWQCRWAPTLGSLERTHREVWGTREYESIYDPAVFFGLYGLPDFYRLWQHKGQKAVLWAGSDINHFIDGYWLDDGSDRRQRLMPMPLARWLNAHCENWVENEIEKKALALMGIEAKVCPSFLGNVDDFEVSYNPSKKPKLYTSVSGDNFELYGWHKIPKLAQENPQFEFHLYGNTKPFRYFSNNEFRDNIFIHGRVSNQQMNNEIKEMQGALRLIETEGFSEIIAKSILWAQWPVSLIEYPFMLKLHEIDLLKNIQEPNIEGRNYYRQVLNDYPWNIKK